MERMDGKVKLIRGGGKKVGKGGVEGGNVRNGQLTEEEKWEGREQG